MRPALRLSPQFAPAEAARSGARSAPRFFPALPARLQSMRLRALLFGTLLAAMLVAGPVAARDLIVRTEAGSVKLTEVASGLQNPWSLAFLPDGRMLAVVQIAGLVARRIVCSVNEGMQMEAGERFGLIRFGSRTDLYLPPGVEPLVAVGQTMVGGETVMARL